MSGEIPGGSEGRAVRKQEEKRAEHIGRIQRTAVASFAGIAVGVLSFRMSGIPDPLTGLQPDPTLGILLLLAGIVFQKYIFMALRIDASGLGAKDWFYQGFMTFAFWYISWTLLLTAAVIPAATAI
ncbi:MAG: hypothetical protein LUQ40_01685 [Methanomicrobiales archaeon]|nr:hypothetical protein [Methanomicrobiales archaeon]